MKRTLIFIASVMLVTLISCTTPPASTNQPQNQVPLVTTAVNKLSALPDDTPRFTADGVLEIARKRSPDCRIQVGIQNTMGCRCSETPLYEETEPLYQATYTGNGTWIVTKTCSVNTVFSRYWNFYEETEELVIEKQ
jgi:hypothetical protein